MYNLVTESTIRSAPRISNINTDRLPEELSRIFATIVELRSSVTVDNDLQSETIRKEIAMLKSLALNLQTIVAVYRKHEHHRSAAFVGATAHYLLMQIQALQSKVKLYTAQIEEDFISSSVAAILLFMIANSPADASEIASKLLYSTEGSNGLLMKLIILLAQGNLTAISQEEVSLAINNEKDEYDAAVDKLWDYLSLGIVQMASELIGIASVTRQDYFSTVMELAVHTQENADVESAFPGPFHLAQLLRTLGDQLVERGIVKIKAPAHVDPIMWDETLSSMARQRPYLWENHTDAIDKDFLKRGMSSVLTFPTGAGKSTLSELKIASVVLSGSNVLYLVPTHALEDQMRSNIRRIFGQTITVEGTVSIDGEYTEIDAATPTVAIMTPERCLTMLSMESNRFDNIGLVVFDEFHLIHGKGDANDRRNIDAMFCLLSLFEKLPNADYLLISAMVQNGEEIADWIRAVTNRQCICLNSQWKPTRQIQACVVYDASDLKELNESLISFKKKVKPKNGRISSPGQAIVREIKARPLNFFSLRNMWDSTSEDDYRITRILPDKVQLSASAFWKVTPNRNEVASEYAAHFCSLGIKTLVFVSDPRIANSTKKRVLEKIGDAQPEHKDFEKQRVFELTSLKAELGDLKYSFFSLDEKVAVHHGDLMPLERGLCEGFFKEEGGYDVIVATPTLAQGINLPAEVVIIAGDDKFDAASQKVESIAPHELLNAAGRAGRAGMSSQGVVLVIPGIVVGIDGRKIDTRWWELKDKVFSKSDQCLIVQDPLNQLIDSLSSAETLTSEQLGLILKLKPESISASETRSIFKKSFAAYGHGKTDTLKDFDEKVDRLIAIRNGLHKSTTMPLWAESVSLKMGVDSAAVMALGSNADSTVMNDIASLTVVDCVKWFFTWLRNNPQYFLSFFTKPSTLNDFYEILCVTKSKSNLNDIITRLGNVEDLLLAYLKGETFESMEKKIIDKPDQYLSHARTFILKVVPEFSYVFGIFALTMKEMFLADGGDSSEFPEVLKVLASCIREGFDSVEKLHRKTGSRFSRVEVHREFASKS
jgi:ATP-dependent RNA helicase DOB1